ncbi:hypothetical protein MKQ68_18920 [Chitinophaga horti]|uniref:Uncharacterized protein n=1 Tax=Chitinophaga horti TaxID=2920382 RepID=A0ABY6IXQ1_9BACT|nr:hypothetical protein [Chitinophaga horti]UYQ92163.1 hypothetical protein MKQ68_18920 [Chitinophaga horti]
MFSAYTWMDYLKIVSIGGLLYYAFVALRYYPKEIENLFGRKKWPPHGVDSIQSAPDAYTHAEVAVAGSNLNDAELLMGEAKDLITRGQINQVTKAELLQGLQQLFSSHFQLGSPAFRGAINEFIVSESESRGNVRLTEEEVDLLWTK